jgi:hypothetical protein
MGRGHGSEDGHGIGQVSRAINAVEHSHEGALA